MHATAAMCKHTPQMRHSLEAWIMPYLELDPESLANRSVKRDVS